jgi:hypothetical protein
VKIGDFRDALSWKTVRLTEDDKQVAEVTREAVIEEPSLRRPCLHTGPVPLS